MNLTSDEVTGMVTVGRKYQVVIEQTAREKRGIQPGWIAAQTVVGDQLKTRFLPPEHDRSLAGTLRAYARGPVKHDAAEREAGWARQMAAELHF